MNEQDREAFLTELLGIAEQASDKPLDAFTHGMSWEMGDQILTLPEPVAFAFLALAGRLARQHPWVDRFSEEHIRERLVSILRTTRRGDREAARQLLGDLIGEVEEYSIERTVYVPVQGLMLSLDELEFGRVAFRKVDNKVLSGLQELITAIYTGPDGEVQHQAYVSSRQAEIGQELGGKVCAVFRTTAEPIRAREQAEVETRRSLEVITFINAALHPFHPRADAVLSLAGEAPSLGPWVAVAATGQFHHSQRAAASSLPVEVSAGSVEQLDRGGAFALSDLLAQPEELLTDLEHGLLRAVHWFATSQAQAEHENRLLNLITSLESLLGPDDRTRIAGTVAERTALIVARGEYREGVRKFVRDLYRARSGVSHGGAKTVTEADVKELRWIAAELITTLVRRRDRVRTKDELLAWLDRLAEAEDLVEPTAPPGVPKTVRDWREERAWSQEDLARRIGREWIDAEAVDRWETWRLPPDAGYLRYLANALGVRPEEIALPLGQRWVVVRGHRFHLTAHRAGPGNWVARESGWDYADAVEWPLRAVDPTYPEIDSPTIIAEWRSSGITADRALDALANRIVAAMERALSKARLPDDPPDWQPPELLRH